MKYLLIDPQERETEIRSFDHYKLALAAAGLVPGEIDFGSIGPNLSIMVYEYGLIKPQVDAYFTIGGQLFCGPAVIYQTDDEGETIDITADPAIHFLGNADAAELSIQRGETHRPQSSINGEVYWQWKKPQ